MTKFKPENYLENLKMPDLAPFQGVIIQAEMEKYD